MFLEISQRARGPQWSAVGRAMVYQGNRPAPRPLRRHPGSTFTVGSGRRRRRRTFQAVPASGAELFCW